MTRIDELQKKYPSIPKDIIVKWEVLANRIRDSKDLDKISNWRSASGSYQNYDAELTMERMAKETPWRVRDGAVLLPGSLLMSTGLALSLQRDPRSPYTIREVSDGKFALFEGEEMVDVDLYPGAARRQRTGPELVTSKGTPVQNLVEPLSRYCYRVIPVRFCEYFNTGEECKFCNFNPTQDDAKSVGLKRAISINPEETAEAFKLLGSEIRLLEGFFEGGGFATFAAESSVNCRFASAMSKVLPYETHMKLVAEAVPRKELLRLRDAGLKGIRFQMETFDERLFPIILPGKAKHLSREGWLEAFQDAVDIFGVGNVAGKFVGGVTLQGPDGYSTWEEARDSHMDGDRWMISHGVYPGMQPLRWAPGSPFSKDPANRTKFAPTEFFLDLMVAHHAAMKEYGLYDKLNRFLYCAFDCLTPMYAAEMGILEIAGDVGAWMSKVAPYEANWVAQALDSIKAGAQVQ